ncbi:MAG TPA: hypothetical protein PKH19_02755 [Candidatus Syntrophosphaera sp.]|nr:hypothetical protein [Candidatus Syntrophosphaera sp.]
MPETSPDRHIQPLPQPGPRPPQADKLPEAPDTDDEGKKPMPRGSRNFVPIIMSLALICVLGLTRLQAQVELVVSLGAGYTDNVLQLSEHDLQRFDRNDSAFSYVDTSDDLQLSARLDLAYPLRYRWWKFTPSLTATVSEHVSNQEKWRRDAIIRLRTDRYYWNLTLLYGYYPHSYVRSYVDTDGSGEMEPYSYARNLYRADLNLKPLKHATVQLHGRWEQHFYNQYWTEYDGTALQAGIGFRYSFPVFNLSGSYNYRSFDNSGAQDRDYSYDSNIYSGTLQIKPMPLFEDKPQGPSWYPALTLDYEQRYFQSLDDWYGGRMDRTWTTNAACNFNLSPRWKILLDYSHRFRNVDSPVAAVRRAREYGANRITATAKYSF